MTEFDSSDLSLPHQGAHGRVVPPMSEVQPITGLGSGYTESALQNVPGDGHGLPGAEMSRIVGDVQSSTSLIAAGEVGLRGGLSSREFNPIVASSDRGGSGDDARSSIEPPAQPAEQPLPEPPADPPPLGGDRGNPPPPDQPPGGPAASGEEPERRPLQPGDVIHFREGRIYDGIDPAYAESSIVPAGTAYAGPDETVVARGREDGTGPMINSVNIRGQVIVIHDAETQTGAVINVAPESTLDNVLLTEEALGEEPSLARPGVTVHIVGGAEEVITPDGVTPSPASGLMDYLQTVRGMDDVTIVPAEEADIYVNPATGYVGVFPLEGGESLYEVEGQSVPSITVDQIVGGQPARDGSVEATDGINEGTDAEMRGDSARSVYDFTPAQVAAEVPLEVYDATQLDTEVGNIALVYDHQHGYFINPDYPLGKTASRQPQGDPAQNAAALDNLLAPGPHGLRQLAYMVTGNNSVIDGLRTPGGDETALRNLLDRRLLEAEQHFNDRIIAVTQHPSSDPDYNETALDSLERQRAVYAELREQLHNFTPPVPEVSLQTPDLLAPNESFDPALNGPGADFLVGLFDPDNLPGNEAQGVPRQVSTEFKEYLDNGATPPERPGARDLDPQPTLDGDEALVDYRKQFGPLTLVGYEMIVTPADAAPTIPGTDGEKYNWGVMFISTFWPPEPAWREFGRPFPIHVMMVEHIDYDPDTGEVRGRTYQPVTENGLDASGSQHAFVGRQIEFYTEQLRQLSPDDPLPVYPNIKPLREYYRQVYGIDPTHTSRSEQ